MKVPRLWYRPLVENISQTTFIIFTRNMPKFISIRIQKITNNYSLEIQKGPGKVPRRSQRGAPSKNTQAIKKNLGFFV